MEIGMRRLILGAPKAWLKQAGRGGSAKMTIIP